MKAINKARNKLHQHCARCGARFDGDLSRCISCGHWNIGNEQRAANVDETVLLSDVTGASIERILTGYAWDRCFGGIKEGLDVVGKGIALGTTILLGGVAGAGKSTLALQLSDIIASEKKREVFYVAAEESAAQIKDRALRLNLQSSACIRLVPMGAQVDLGATLLARKPVAVIVDSLPGFVETPDEAVELCKSLKHVAVQLNAPILIIDHINKQDDFAGFEKLKHEVDTTISLFTTGDGERREMTTHKNRFGMANVTVGLLMTERGLVDSFVEDEEEEDEDEC